MSNETHVLASHVLHIGGYNIYLIKLHLLSWKLVNQDWIIYLLGFLLLVIEIEYMWILELWHVFCNISTAIPQTYSELNSARYCCVYFWTTVLMQIPYMWLCKMIQILVMITLVYTQSDATVSLRKESDPVTQRVAWYFN